METEHAGSPISLDDPRGFEAFYRAALPQVYGYLFHRCGGITSVAEDLTQETFIALVVSTGLEIPSTVA